MSQSSRSLCYNTSFQSIVYDFQGLSSFHTWSKPCYTRRIAYDWCLPFVPEWSLFHLFALSVLMVEIETFVAKIEADGVVFVFWIVLEQGEIF